MVIMAKMIQVREGEVGWQQAVVISLESILYLHCHQVMMTVITIIIKFDELVNMVIALFQDQENNGTLVMVGIDGKIQEKKKDKTFPTHPGIQYPPIPDNNNNSKYDKTIFNDYNKKLTQVSSILPSTFQPETLCKPSLAVCKLLSYLQVLL